LGERLLCKQEVIGSIPFTSTTGEPRVRRAAGVASTFWPEANPGKCRRARLGEDDARYRSPALWRPGRGC
jgi:hypothetical protein